MRTAKKAVVVSRCVRGIDERGLHVTNLAAMRDALARVARPDGICLTDGFPVPDFGYEQRAVINGDAQSAAIAAASILAKVSRDRFMKRAAALHPHWDFAIPRRLLDARAPRGDRGARRLAAAPPELPEPGVPAAGAVAAPLSGRSATWRRRFAVTRSVPR